MLRTATGGSSTLHALMLGAEIAPSLNLIRNLDIRAHRPRSLPGFGLIALKCSPSLQHLAITIGFNQDPLPALPNLRTLTLQASVEGVLPRTVFAVIVSLPECMPRIERINVHLSAVAFDFTAPRGHFPECDDALKRLPKLTKLHFAIHGPINVDVSVRATLPRANDAGILAFSAWEAPDELHPLAAVYD
ncbi:hypothetical protein FB451DRAFT_1433486 [Mycena latifolia]|nr:hypothetical protein FB451DRAFT_1433486 [Mycena latifolia]